MGILSKEALNSTLHTGHSSFPELLNFSKEALINPANEIKHQTHGTQRPRPINKIGKEASAAQRSDSLV